MNNHLPQGFEPTQTEGASIQAQEGGIWRLAIPAGGQGQYRVAQIDDYGDRRRSAFPHRAPYRFSLRARVSHEQVPGTWGFGLWNNPFSMAVATGVEVLRLPALPNTAWFFHASPPNHLSLYDDQPALGWLAGTFRSPLLPGLLLGLGAPLAALMLVRPLARALRRLGRLLVRQDTVALNLDPMTWHSYELEWSSDRVLFRVDGRQVLQSARPPLGPLGLVIWIDNQYAALRPDGSLGFGTLPTPESMWMEIADFE